MNEFERYNVNLMPLSSDPFLRCAQEKLLNDQNLTIKEKLALGIDHPVRKIGNYNLKPDCVYRAISVELYHIYLETGFIYGTDENDEYEEEKGDNIIYNNNRGVDWYLGGVCLKYGGVVIEAPALLSYFTPAYDYGCHLSYDPRVRHMKSSGFKNPVPMSIVRVIKYQNQIIDNDILEINDIKR